ncbi:MAG: TIGR01212 family radical SAM protein [Bdellovibrio sp.]|nr:TIGR01212 family radical SAM protein [Bdellovibrio sp.]
MNGHASLSEVKRYYPYSQYLLDTFGGKTYKIVVASGLTCPTRDGKLAKAGCAFCDVRGSSSFFGKKGRGGSVQEQILKRLPEIRDRFSATRFLAYFQSYTNTYSDVNYLREIYEAALAVPEIQGLCIGTRPDCLPPAVLELLEELAQKTYVSLELGVQSFENSTLDWLVRGHDRDCSLDALERLRTHAPSVHVCVHLMFGSPTDSISGAREAAQILNQAGIRGVKLHQLMILENTELAERFRAQPFPTLELSDYAEKVSEFIDHLSPKIYLERLCATATHKEECIAPAWSRQRWEPHNVIRSVLEKNGTLQGRFSAEQAQGT